MVKKDKSSSMTHFIKFASVQKNYSDIQYFQMAHELVSISFFSNKCFSVFLF